jgi:hypothetical protein
MGAIPADRRFSIMQQKKKSSEAKEKGGQVPREASEKTEHTFFVPGDRGGEADESKYEAPDEEVLEADQGEYPAGHRHRHEYSRNTRNGRDTRTGS